jgi:hypothetical protein
MKKIPLNFVNVSRTNNAKSKKQSMPKMRSKVEQLHVLKMAQVPFALKSLMVVVFIGSVAVLVQNCVNIYNYIHHARKHSIAHGIYLL